MERRERLRLLAGRPLPRLNIRQPVHPGMQPRRRKNHRLVAQCEQILPHHLADKFQHIVLYRMSHAVVEHLHIRVFHMVRNHLHLFVHQHGRGVHHRIQDRLRNRNHGLCLGQKILRMMPPGRRIVDRRYRVEARHRRHTHKRRALAFGQILHRLCQRFHIGFCSHESLLSYSDSSIRY